ncbi:dTDP-glucose 4,6-dehydratase [Actinoplanes sp. NBRC 103695]|uniref:dTDP-glucose 4,6-dehydratase n=1 Tax=Actinoplanes sp. NBRC 103695 TaxID=3032202 RepID=UPI0024A2A771|nr:dTDP-glucose 4,6-dehydratase [Actinoplanes sp. NBRC 103695]GLZ00622.1 dTDP-glucose 4,6-dehydratase [Actinoplanes sp. NBRC 103695]
MKLLVTGGAGFIGSHLVRSVLWDRLPGLEGARVTVLDKLTYAGNLANLGPVAESDRLDFIPGDVCDAALVDTVMRGVDAVVHAAAESHVDRSIVAAGEFAVTNVIGTQVLLDAALRHGTARFLHVSTDEVYGSIPAGAWTERSSVRPNSPYAATKASSDLLALAYHRTHGLPVVVTRCSNNYGPFQHPEKLIPRFVTNLLSGRTVPLYGDGSQVRDWVHVDDHCRGLALALADGEPGEVYHIAGTVELTNRELTDRLLELCGAGQDRVVHVADRKGHDFRYALDDDRIRRELGYRPRVGFDAGLAATVAWYRDHEPWWRPLTID